MSTDGMDPLLEQRAALCDLLLGRVFRDQADMQLHWALSLEEHGHAELAEKRFSHAAHIEWIASLAEQGRIRFGGRLNRCGYQPEVSE